MYSLNFPVSQIRTKTRQEFERHRYVAQLSTVDVLLFKADAELQETLNYWKQLNHVMKYFRADEEPNAKLPQNFITGFLQVSGHIDGVMGGMARLIRCESRAETECVCHETRYL